MSTSIYRVAYAFFCFKAMYGNFMGGKASTLGL